MSPSERPWASRRTPQPGRQSGFIEIVKGLSVFVSTVVIAFAGQHITASYNRAQLQIARTHELTELVRLLSSQNQEERRVATTMLPYYGSFALPVWINLLGDQDDEVANSAFAPILATGAAAVPGLQRVSSARPDHPAGSDLQRVRALFLLSVLDSANYMDQNASLILDPGEKDNTRTKAIEIVGDARDARYAKTLTRLVETDPGGRRSPLVWALWGLGVIGDSSDAPGVVRLLDRNDDDLHRWVYKTLMRLEAYAFADTVLAYSQKERDAETKATAQSAHASLSAVRDAAKREQAGGQ